MAAERIVQRLSRPAPAAALLALLYALLGSLYIHLSTRFAAAGAHSIAELEHRELIKGVLYVTVTSVLLFLLCFALLHRVVHERRRLAALEVDLVEAEARRLPALFASSLAHDLNNLLGVALLRTDLLRARSAQPEVAEAARELERALRALDALSRRLSELGRNGTAPRHERFAVDALLADVCELARGHAAFRRCRFETAIETSVEIGGDRTLLGRALLNLLLNAAQAAGAGRVRLEARESGGGLVLAVHDNGPGVPSSDREEIFRPFFTTKPAGSGLGLASVRAAAEAFGGTILVEDSLLGGACFRFVLPLPRRDSGEIATA
jgi:signal transduction histidine kinase